MSISLYFLSRLTDVTPAHEYTKALTTHGNLEMQVAHLLAKLAINENGVIWCQNFQLTQMASPGDQIWK